jgi:hypothetical protein
VSRHRRAANRFCAILQKAAFDDAPIGLERLQERYQPKFFLLSKISIGSSRAACSALLRPPQRASARFDHATIEFEKCLQLKCLLKKLLVAPFCVGALVASPQAPSIVGRHQVRRALATLRVNTSLSRTLFFLVRWCIRVEVHLDSRVHIATKPTHTGGHHG